MGMRVLEIDAVLLPQLFRDGNHGGYRVESGEGGGITPTAKVVQAGMSGDGRSVKLVLECPTWKKARERNPLTQLDLKFTATDPSLHPFGKPEEKEAPKAPPAKPAK